MGGGADQDVNGAAHFCGRVGKNGHLRLLEPTSASIIGERMPGGGREVGGTPEYYRLQHNRIGEKLARRGGEHWPRSVRRHLGGFRLAAPGPRWAPRASLNALGGDTILPQGSAHVAEGQ